MVELRVSVKYVTTELEVNAASILNKYFKSRNLMSWLPDNNNDDNDGYKIYKDVLQSYKNIII